MKYYIDITLTTRFESAVELIKNSLPAIGFGVVTEFDVDKKLNEKLGVDFRKYKIIGVCNPKYAYEALKIEPMIGVMLPCNIIIQEIEPNKILIAAIDPVASMQAIENAELHEAARNIKDLLEKFITGLK